MVDIAANVKRILAELPPGVTLLAAVKGRTAGEVAAAVEAGVSIVGANYVQEAERLRPGVPGPVAWHLIGHLQRNKVRRAVRLFDLIETVDSVALAAAIDRCSREIGRVMPVLLEVNSAREPQKAGVLPEDVEPLLRQIASLPGLRVEGLMTMGPAAEDPEVLRPFFRLTYELYRHLGGLGIAGVRMRYLSMGMTSSYRVAVEEGANLVRIGTLIFGPRPAG